MMRIGAGHARLSFVRRVLGDSSRGYRTRMKVEIDIFSGRPNPSWLLSESEAVHVETLLLDLPWASSQPAGGLGYRGFKLTDGERRIRVFSGVIRIQVPPHVSYFKDEKGLEDFLRELAAQRGIQWE